MPCASPPLAAAIPISVVRMQCSAPHHSLRTAPLLVSTPSHVARATSSHHTPRRRAAAPSSTLGPPCQHLGLLCTSASPSVISKQVFPTGKAHATTHPSPPHALQQPPRHALTGTPMPEIGAERTQGELGHHASSAC
jgi:hypothetical protein